MLTITVGFMLIKNGGFYVFEKRQQLCYSKMAASMSSQSQFIKKPSMLPITVDIMPIKNDGFYV